MYYSEALRFINKKNRIYVIKQYNYKSKMI
jgi:hypothetical protein